MERVEVRLAGLGGHGILLMGRILGYAAVRAGFDATMTVAYSPEQRGGWSMADVVISKGVVDYPMVSSPDVLAVTTQETYRRFLGSLRRGGFLIYEESLVKVGECPGTCIGVPAIAIAERVSGRRLPMNMALLGVVTAVIGFIDREYVIGAIRSAVRRGTEEVNVKAFLEGYDYAVGKLKR